MVNKDPWDVRARGITAGRDDALLVELARRFLAERGDQTLGLAPLRLLPARKAASWILFWTAARRVDDSVESGARSVEDWRQALDARSGSTLAGQCMQAFLARPEGAGTPRDLVEILQRGLDGLDREAYFDKPRTLPAYLDLIHDKSATAMIVLDKLLFPGESEAVVRRHAEAFAATTQVGDDCRDVERDLRGGRCFVTLQELQGQTSLTAYVKSSTFPLVRAAMCRYLLKKADHASARFQIAGHKVTARRLADLWLRAIESGQIHPTKKTLDLSADAPIPKQSTVKLPRAVEAVLADRF